MNLFATVNHGLHLMGVLFWVGGTAFEVLMIVPLLRRWGVPSGFLDALSRRFRSSVNPIILVVLVTGGINFGVRRAGGEMPTAYITALGVKVLLVAAMVSLHFFRGVAISMAEGETASDRLVRDWPGIQYARMILIIGMTIIFIAAMLRHFLI